MSSLALLVLALWILPSSTAPGGWPAQSKPATHTVTIDASKFSPATISVKPGDSILWVNKDLVPHTASSSVSREKGGFDSGTIDPGKSWKYTPKAVGAFGYVCLFHPTMKGMLRVQK